MILYNYDVLWLSLHDSAIICYTSINTLTVYYNRLFVCKVRVYSAFQKSLIIHEQSTKKIIAVKESLYVMKHT